MAQFNDGRHIAAIIDREICKKHNALKGAPCFLVKKSNIPGYYAAICNKRAVKAGANGKISDSSLRKTDTQRRQSNKNSKDKAS